MIPVTGADINAQSSSGRTPLLEAVIDQQLDLARMLIDLGADLDSQDTKRTSALHHMCLTRRPDLDFIRLLLESRQS